LCTHTGGGNEKRGGRADSKEEKKAASLSFPFFTRERAFWRFSPLLVNYYGWFFEHLLSSFSLIVDWLMGWGRDSWKQKKGIWLLSKKRKKEKRKEKRLSKEFKIVFYIRKRIIQNVAPAKSTPSMGVMGMLAKPAKGELPPLPKGEIDDGGWGKSWTGALLEVVAVAFAAFATADKTTPWSGEPEEVHLTGARGCCCGCCGCIWGGGGSGEGENETGGRGSTGPAFVVVAAVVVASLTTAAGTTTTPAAAAAW
jgi:hypothetical protein